MQMLYNSEKFVVVAFEIGVAEAVNAANAANAAPAARPVQPRGGYEIVDKFARKEIFIEGAVAASFQQGVQALVAQGPDVALLDEFIGRFTALAQQPVMLH